MLENYFLILREIKYEDQFNTMADQNIQFIFFLHQKYTAIRYKYTTNSCSSPR